MASHTRSSASLPRIVLGTILVTTTCLPSMYHPLLSSTYGYLYQSSIYRSSMFETLLTVVSYAVIELSYTRKFGHQPHLRIDIRNEEYDARKTRPRLPKMRRPSQRLWEILVYVAPLLTMDLIMIKKFAGVSIDELRRTGGYRPIDANAIADTTKSSGLIYTTPAVSASFLAPTLHNFSTTSPLQLQRALPLSPPSSRLVILELIVSLFIYDALFFLTHLAFHKVKALSIYHHVHHTHAEIYPQITNRLSVIERLSLVMLANFSLNIIGSHVLTRTCFVPLFVYLLVEIHSGMDLDWGYHRLMPDNLAAGPRQHAEHHRTGGGGYAPFFRWCDVLLELFEGRATVSDDVVQS